MVLKSIFNPNTFWTKILKAAIVIVKDKLNCTYVHFRLIAISNTACKLGYGISSTVCPKNKMFGQKARYSK